MLILGVESSCDETAAAVLLDGKELLSNVINTQIAVHSKYGGVVPELASRKHLEAISPVVDEALDLAGVSLAQIDGLAVTRGPGLIGSLLVGFSFVKALSMSRQIPYIGVNHMAGHLLSVFLDREHFPEFPYIALVASGGHSTIFEVESSVSYDVIGRTRDDAAGEAFDKVAKMMGLPYPGGPVISKLAASGDPGAISFPRAWLEKDSLDFSFSGVKTAVSTYLKRQTSSGKSPDVNNVCASFQESVADVLSAKTIRAAISKKIKRVVLAGGVAANPRLRELLIQRGKENDIEIFIPAPEFCTDNAAMIAMAGFFNFAEATLDVNQDVFSRYLI
jgi:N6-L-threonylcarbamoyladenine synthase